jgi:hypothetical protein
MWQLGMLLSDAFELGHGPSQFEVEAWLLYLPCLRNKMQILYHATMMFGIIGFIPLKDPKARQS